MTVKTFANINPLGNLSYRMQVLTGKKKKGKKISRNHTNLELE